MRWFVEYQLAGKPAQHHELTGLSKVACGSEPGMHLRFPETHGLPGRLLEAELKQNEVFLCGTSLETPDVEYNGRNYREVAVAWEQDAFVGPLRICFLRTDGNSSAKGTGASGLLAMLVVALLVLGILGQQIAQKRDGRIGVEPEPPGLFGPPVLHCAQPTGAGFLERVDVLRQVAEGKMARYSFDASVGVGAVALLEQASACLAASKLVARNHAEQSLVFRQDAERLRARIEQDYASLRLSLEFAQIQGDAVEVIRLTTRLAAMLSIPPNHPYARWLGGLKRDALDQLRAKAEQD